ncbi:histidine kinase N-terminal 7TM domain-containing diguanylate cyclase [Paenibacillus cremeus]|uniref:Diguanylate cyclase n=1 Tax=Paenibacillus cremeus TaxID=2163881 RepID=A0A559K6Q1_9BACL|nr:diguanylate cyclase [Paenibacillus cremeus]TVY07801.1 diguanylate cyclase [Paenibacillus cremeus]
MLLHTEFPFSTLFSFFVFMALALYALPYRKAPGALYFICYISLSAILALESVGELVSASLPAKLIWRNLEQIPLFASAPLFCGMVMELTGLDQKKLRARLFWFSLPIAVYLLLIFTDSYHHLMRSHISIESFGNASRVQVQSTTLSLLFLAYDRVLFMFSVVFLLYRLQFVSRYNRSQYWLIILSCVIPYICFLLANIMDIDINVSVASVPGGLILCVAIFQYKLLRVRPIVKDKIIEHMKEGVVVLDPNHVILDLNPSAVQSFAKLGCTTHARKLLGQHLPSIFEAQPELLLHVENTTENEFRLDAPPHYFSVSLLPIKSRSLRTGTLLIFTDISDQVAYETELVRQATVDGLTQVYNRQYMVETTGTLMLKHTLLSFILIDIDYFKSINDLHGHQTGDRALTQVAAIIRDTVGDSGTVGRMGGEEFAVSLPDIELIEALHLAEAIRLRVAQSVIVNEYSGAELYCTVSIGVSTMPSGGLPFTELYQAADDGLYQSKHKGRNLITAI